MTSQTFCPPAATGNSIQTPITPTPQPASLPNQPSPTSVAELEKLQSSRVEKGGYVSPAPPSSSDMTPPPSSQLPPQPSSPIYHGLPTTALLVSPPATLRSAPPLQGFNALSSSSILPLPLPLPSAEQIAKASETELRNIINELMPALGEARMSAAHYKLQHQLLSLETSESAMRAAVEHDMTRREVDVLQRPEHRRCNTLSLSGQHQIPPMPPSDLVDNALQKRYEQLEKSHAILAVRFRRAKKVILFQESKSVDLVEENHRLRQRIKENREHINQIRNSGGLSVASTPRNEKTTPQRKAIPRFQNSARSNAHMRSLRTNGQDPFAALLAADQVLSGETASVPSTPIQNHTSKVHLGHTRGTHSLSSLPTTPARSRPVTADSPIFTPVNRIAIDNGYSYSAPNTQSARADQERRREDRDSTISASDNEDEAYTDEDIPQSQASQAATHMLRRSPTRRVEIVGTPAKPLTSSTLMQGKLFGQVKKTGIARFDSSVKRKTVGDDVGSEVSEAKKTRMSEGVGLGIGNWGSPGA
ncbi:MAG: hypothetical protein M1830_005594 [Pleopsidium flavum]|nr:MAG: hypothetical protein M1830_005594 [Pleopsidium flavum]